MRTFIICCIAMLFSSVTYLNAQLLVVQDPYVLLLNDQTGAIEDAQFIDLTGLNPGTPKGIRQIGDEIWITDQIEDVIYRFDLSGTYLSSISGGLDNIKGLNLVNGTEVWVTNAGTGNGAPGNAIVKFDMAGNNLGNFLTNGISSFDLIDNQAGEVYISYISGGSPIERRAYDGSLLGNVVEPGILAFVQQLWLMDSGDLLVGTFSSPSGIYIFDPDTGTQLNYWNESGVRGVAETADGNILWTNSSGIHLLDVGSGTSTLLSSGSAQFFAKLASTGCTTPNLSVDTPAPICEGSTVSLTATTNGDYVEWYDSETSTSPIASGLVFETPALTANTSYWAQAFSEGEGDVEILEGAARLAPTGTSSSSVVSSTSPWGLSFDVTDDFTITSVDVFLASNDPGDLVMQLLDENWVLIEETTVACPAGSSTTPVQFTVPLNFSVQGGNNYKIVAESSPVMIREFSSQHPGFPYPIGTVGSVTGGTINSSNTNATVYYFFYNWTVEIGSVEICESTRVQVDVTVNPTPATPTGDADQNFTAGQTLADLVVTASGTLTWYSDPDGLNEIPDTTELQDGVTYYVSQIVNGCESELLAITVHLIMGVNDASMNSFAVYPNPVTSWLNIHGKKQIQSVEVYDMTGSKIDVQNQLNFNRIDFSAYAAGTYLLKIIAEGDVQSIKIIKK